MKTGRTKVSLLQRGLRAAVAIAFLGGLALLSGSKMPARPSLPPCGLHVLTGRPCPFCGGTRAARAILDGNWDRALYLNAFAFPALVLIFGVAAVLLIEAITARDVLSWKSASGWISRRGPLLLALAVVWWGFHLVLALRTPKPELVNLHNPIAAGLRSQFASAGGAEK